MILIGLSMPKPSGGGGLRLPSRLPESDPGRPRYTPTEPVLNRARVGRLTASMPHCNSELNPTTKAHLAKAGAAKPRVLASSATPALRRHDGPMTAEPPQGTRVCPPPS